MKYSYPLILGMLCILMVQACTERMICPAYQSAFIHDEEALRKRFSYFKEDSTPKILEASKDRYLLLEPVSYRRKLKSLQTIPMEDVYFVEEDSLEFDDDALLLAERDVRSKDQYNEEDLLKDHSIETAPVDSSAADSAYVISIKKEKFNIDQELYLWYLRKYLIYPDIRLQMEDNAEEDAELTAESAEEEKKGFFGFFKNLFKKKNKDEEEVEGSGEDNEERTSATEIDDAEVVEEKKGFFSFLKKKGDKPPKEKKTKVKKEKKKKKKDEAPTEETPPEVDEDDGEDDF